MARSRRSAPPLAILALVTIAACSPAASAGPSGPSAPSAPPSTQLGSPRPATPSAPETAGPAVAELPPAPTVLDAGRYTRAGFEPAITLEVAGGAWQTGQLLPGFFDIQQDPGSPDVIAVQFARPDGAYGANGAAVTVATAAAAVAAIEANPGLEILSTATSDGHVGILRVPPGPLGIDPGRRLWIALFDTTDGLLAILVGGSVAGWDAALLAAEPVLESVTIGQ
jgi:hypothetical protein